MRGLANLASGDVIKASEAKQTTEKTNGDDLNKR